MDEQLAFPSGTATAQLISVLHRLPPPDTTIRRRHGYREIDREETDILAAEPDPLTPVDEDAPLTDLADDEKAEGWAALTWSFLASGIMTVGSLSPRDTSPFTHFAILKLTAYFFPVTFSIPVFGHYLAREWLWSFTPSLSYIGQGRFPPLNVTRNQPLIGYHRHHHGVSHYLKHELGW